MHGEHELRHQFREQRRAIDVAVRKTASEDAAEAAYQWLKGHKPKRVALFVSLADEIDTAPLFARLQSEGVGIALPRVRLQETSLDFVIADDLQNLTPGPFRLLEPRGEAVPLSTIDVVVVPGLAFDKSGGRLGYGAGYYDRSLADFERPTLGLCYRFQLVDEALPVAPHDRHVTAIAYNGGVHIAGVT